MYCNNLIKQVCFFGDWHGNYPYARKAVYRAVQDYPEAALVHVGDFGLWRHTGFGKVMDQELARYEKELWVVPGNHEDYAYIKLLKPDERGLIKVKDHIFLVPRGYKWEWGGRTLAGLGGAYSIDKRYRREGVDWFPEEMITHEDYLATIADVEKIDLLVTHEAPKAPPEMDSPWKLTRKEASASKLCRDYIARVIFERGVELNVHGHHHSKYKTKVGGCTVVGLGADRGQIEANRQVIDLADFDNMVFDY